MLKPFIGSLDITSNFRNVDTLDRPSSDDISCNMLHLTRCNIIVVWANTKRFSSFLSFGRGSKADVKWKAVYAFIGGALCTRGRARLEDFPLFKLQITCVKVAFLDKFSDPRYCLPILLTRNQISEHKYCYLLPLQLHISSCILYIYYTLASR